jgi:hypothetical protein
MYRSIQLTPTQQVNIYKRIQSIGVVKRGRSAVEPAAVAKLKPEQLLSTEIMELEVVDWPSDQAPIPTENSPYGACSLSELRVELPKEIVCWYVLLHGGLRYGPEQELSVFDHYDAAQKAYHQVVFSRPPKSLRRPARRQPGIVGPPRSLSPI